MSLLCGSWKQGEAYRIPTLRLHRHRCQSINQSDFLKICSSLFADALFWTGAAHCKFADALVALWQRSIMFAVVCTAVVRLKFDDVLFHA